MDFREVEKKWQKKWEEDKLFSFDDSHLEKKLYVLEMFSYPFRGQAACGPLV